MVLKKIFSAEFEHSFIGTIILDMEIEEKLHRKHKVYKDDIADALADPYRVVMRAQQKSTTPIYQLKSKGKLFEILCESSDGKVLFIIARLFPDGNLYIITSYWANRELQNVYLQESEVLRDE